MGTAEILFAVALLLRPFCTSVAEDPGKASRYITAAPATCGVAIEVPDRVAVAVMPVYEADLMAEPGARMSTIEPKFEYDAKPSVDVVAPTVMASAVRAGQ